MHGTNKDHYAPTGFAKYLLFFNILAVGGWLVMVLIRPARNGPYSPNFFSVFWGPCEPLANGTDLDHAGTSSRWIRYFGHLGHGFVYQGPVLT